MTNQDDRLPEKSDQLEGVARDAWTLRDVLSELEALGFPGQFAAREGGIVECLLCKSRIAAGDLTARHLRRLEGASDPADMAIVAALECPVCLQGGTLVSSYGPDASPADAEVLLLLDR